MLQFLLLQFLQFTAFGQHSFSPASSELLRSWTRSSVQLPILPRPAMQHGDSVYVKTANPKYNAMSWSVVTCAEPEDQDGSMVLLGMEDGVAKHIAVKKSKVFPSVVVLAQPTLELELNLADKCAFDFSPGVFKPQDLNHWLDKWLQLPNLGGNSILLRRKFSADLDKHPLVLFPNLNEMGLELWFYSTWGGEAIQLLDCDSFKKCPMEQMWPFCSWCRKFILPTDGPGAHRQSKKHQSCLMAIAAHGLATAKTNCLTWSPDCYI